METSATSSLEISSQFYNYAADLMVNQEKSASETKNALISQGLTPENAAFVVENIEGQIEEAKNDKARKDMIYGALWFAGGTILTLSNIGFIFWGAILFGGIQFFRGLINLNS
ncbi:MULTISPECIES: hypothetical protein [unclassified Flavobacterium]|jgi:hypothetical protein|uniref:hypothetical protein n=1 Tax=unclassified Flavobacterium TaxID=196869 RepID=UPI0007094D83|nr:MULTISPECIES: hypothetical protein [unclassified Flavobacterium]KRD59590.1 hypothetical protein ASE40_10760 [Flavobacterium sp. Root935]TDX14428.1 hypothetical protein EDB96_1169 [Flavobacterium sp. S87F.05.LMB.W.Kidney.N]BDU25043.1 hypothetical protein FLGSB24_17870 [Flavobacterium sp. GSB-24]